MEMCYVVLAGAGFAVVDGEVLAGLSRFVSLYLF
jgi:hypothetical protein